MSDPRDAVSHVGIGYVAETFPCDGTIVYDSTLVGACAQVGLAASIESNNLAGLAADGEAVLGKIIQALPGSMVVVQVGGLMTLPGGNGAALTAGKKIVGALGASSAEGYIREVATATAAELGVMRGMIVDSSTATATVVMLDWPDND